MNKAMGKNKSRKYRDYMNEEENHYISSNAEEYFSDGKLTNDYLRRKETELVESNSVPFFQVKAIEPSYSDSHENFLTKSELQMNREDVSEVASSSAKKKDKKKAESKTPLDFSVKKQFMGNRNVKCVNGISFLYNELNGCYEKISEQDLFVEIRKCLPAEIDMKLGKNKMMDVVHRLVSEPELQATFEEFDRHNDHINFKNCVLNTMNWKTYPHAPNFMFTSHIDAEYKENSPYDFSINGNNFLRFLDDCTEGDPQKIQSLQQLTGYIISNEWRAKKFFVLIGQPHTGKSVWLELFRALIGSKYTTSLTLKQLSENRFMTAELLHSKLNVTAEMDESGTLKATDIIKALTGGDLITAEKKGKDPFHFQSKTKLVACGNQMPLLKKLDGTTAFTDRIAFFMFNNSIPENQRDKSLIKKLLSEKDYIVKWALEGLEDLIDNDFVFLESEDASTLTVLDFRIQMF
ncbi:DNA primase family protein [Paenibacillus sp. HW567]|uniref:DNA primase family protein n=1 Tax=Paenibacillus sp. HW567 TaxID=1034769 RepID=UPI0018DB2D3E|nr:phage/plasmid primase, P4 family [Paenibacillus sp. HW567]